MASPLNIAEADECCGRALNAALLAGLHADTWTHDKCGQVWRVDVVEGVRYWKPEVQVWIL